MDHCFSEYCSNTKPAINHIALSPRRFRLALLPAYHAPRIGQPASFPTLSDSGCSAIVAPAPSLVAMIGRKEFSLNCQSFIFLRASHLLFLWAMHWVQGDKTRCIPTEIEESRLITGRIGYYRTHILYPLVCNVLSNIWQTTVEYLPLCLGAHLSTFLLSKPLKTTLIQCLEYLRFLHQDFVIWYSLYVCENINNPFFG